MRKPELVTTGVTRVVVLAGPLAFKLARDVRGWLANRSEWRQRARAGVVVPLATIGHVVLVVPRADLVGAEWAQEPYGDDGRDEAKPSSWGYFGHTWRLIDYDRAWVEPRGWVGGLYYRRQERLARRWSALPRRSEP